MDDGGFKKKRQNVIGVSLVLILLKYLKVKPPTQIDIFNVIIPFEKPQHFYIALWCLFLYFSYRLYTEWMDTSKDEYIEYMRKNVWDKVKKDVAARVNIDYPKDKLTFIKSDLSSLTHRYFILRRLRFKEWFILSFRYSPHDEEIQEIKLFRTPFNKYVWPSYYKYRIKNFFQGRYLSETILPVTLILITILYVGFPIVVDFVFVNWIL